MQVNGKLRPNAVDENERTNDRTNGSCPAGQIKRNENFWGSLSEGEKQSGRHREREREREEEQQRDKRTGSSS